MVGAGSGEILKVAAVAFTGPGRKLVLANPTFEAIAAHAKTAQAEVIRIDLTSD
jgi:histidinol-phosphate aminotransferase